MKLFGWITNKGTHASAKSRGVLSREMVEVRESLARTQRGLAERVEGALHHADKRLAAIAERIRRFQGARSEALSLEAEQRALGRLLERVEVAEMDTAELLREWRDWMRGVRGGVSLMDGEQRMRVEMVRSELCVRGVIDEERVEVRASVDLSTSGEPQDSLSEWDQYLGERLPATARFWEARAEEAQSGHAHEMVTHDLVKRMRKAHGQARAWHRMQHG